MLTHEWRELEILCDRIQTMRDRLDVALRTKNVGLIEALKKEMRAANALRVHLVVHIAAGLGAESSRPNPTMQ